MKRKNIFIAAAIAVTVGAVAFALDTPSFAQPYQGGWGHMGPGMMGGYGPGWMHGQGGYGPGWMHGQGGYGPGWCWGDDRDAANTGTNSSDQTQSGKATPQQQDTKLTTDDVKARMERWLARGDNPRLKLGDVKEKDADTITADIVTVDNSLVQRFEIDRTTGFTRPTGG